MIRLYARHANGEKSTWDSDHEYFVDAAREVVEAVKEETKKFPLTVLALVTPGFKVSKDED